MKKRNEEITFGDILGIFIPKIWIIIAVSALLAIAFGVRANYTVQDTYTAQTVFRVKSTSSAALSEQGFAAIDKVLANFEYKMRGDEIIFTRDTHNDDYLETAEGIKLPVVHCVKGTYGWQIADGLETDGAIYIDKPTFGWLGWSDMQFDNIELVGLCTDICVVSNALILKALFPDAKICVDASCCAGVTPQSHNAALETMKMCQIDVI